MDSDLRFAVKTLCAQKPIKVICGLSVERAMAVAMVAWRIGLFQAATSLASRLLFAGASKRLLSEKFYPRYMLCVIASLALNRANSKLRETSTLLRKRGKGMVPVERIELPTFGLQNRCSTAELNRLRH
jgi:hypothetical protein